MELRRSLIRLDSDSWDFKSNEPFFKKDSPDQKSDLDLSKRTRNPFKDLNSVFGFTERKTPTVFGFRQALYGFLVMIILISQEVRWD